MSDDPERDRREQPATTLRPTEPQRRYLERGLSQPGGKLPLFDSDGREVAPRTVRACVANGWAEPWLRNPIKPDWLVCRLTAEGYAVLGRTQPPPDLSRRPGKSKTLPGPLPNPPPRAGEGWGGARDRPDRASRRRPTKA